MNTMVDIEQPNSSPKWSVNVGVEILPFPDFVTALTYADAYTRREKLIKYIDLLAHKIVVIEPAVTQIEPVPS
ncbi:MAG TPA: hypothetical protein V6C86_08425 [Oculatellaceae cyanobacterium]